MKKELDLAIRLSAIEYVLTHIGKAVVIAADPNNAPAIASKLRSAARTHLSGDVVPGVGPEWSDHVSAEMEIQVDRLLGDIEAMVAKTYRQ
jgi:hypothetical protein